MPPMAEGNTELGAGALVPRLLSPLRRRTDLESCCVVRVSRSEEIDMRRRIVFVGLASLIAGVMLIPAALAGRVDFRAPLSQAQETMPIDAPGAGGSSEFWLEGTDLHYRISVKHLTGPATQAHIHAPAGRHEDAGVAIWLCGTAVSPGPAGTPACSPATTGLLVEGSTEITPEQLEWLRTRQAYVNVHTAAHPPGEVRGQILPVGGGH